MSKKRITLTKDQVKELVAQDPESGSESDNIDSDASIELSEDEVDLADVSSDEDDEDHEQDEEDDESEEEDDDEEDEDIPKTKKRKKNKDDGNESFANAVNAILGSKLKAYDRKDPILARSKQNIKKAESDKLEAKARRLLLAEKKKVYDKDRVRDLLPKDDSTAREILEHERKLKKVAQRGVIKLFNVIMSTQTRTNSEVSKTKVLGEEQKEKLISEVSKEKFFDLVKAAGEK